MAPGNRTAAGGRRSAAAPAATAASTQAGAAAAASSGSGKRAVIVGAGPAGALAAMLLAQQVSVQQWDMAVCGRGRSSAVAVAPCTAGTPCSPAPAFVTLFRTPARGEAPANARAPPRCPRQGWRVDVFERSEPLAGADGDVAASIGPRSYNILLTERAAVALDAAGVDLGAFDVPDVSLALRHKCAAGGGRCCWWLVAGCGWAGGRGGPPGTGAAVCGAPRRVPYPGLPGPAAMPRHARRLRGGPAEGRSNAMTGRIRVANRGVLAGALVAQCRAAHPEAVQFHFGEVRGGGWGAGAGWLAVGSARASGALLPAVGQGGGQLSGCATRRACPPPADPSPHTRCCPTHAIALARRPPQELSALDTANRIAWFRPSGAQGAGGAAGAAAAAGPGPSGGSSSGDPASYVYDLLVGADGAGSLTRQLLQRYDPELQVGWRAGWWLEAGGWGGHGHLRAAGWTPALGRLQLLPWHAWSGAARPGRRRRHRCGAPADTKERCLNTLLRRCPRSGM